jgi:hypothetical protein
MKTSPATCNVVPPGPRESDLCIVQPSPADACSGGISS